MARKFNHVVLISTLLISASVIEGASIADWVNNFTSALNHELNQMSQNINKQVAEIQKKIETTIQNLPKDEQGNIICTNNTSIISSQIVTINNGVLNSTTRGCINGEPYERTIVEKYIGNILYHTETIFNPKTNTTKTFAWKLDSTVPGAKPVIITNTRRDEIK